MPLINGMKMACEPCIRGHRSTKCTHANERLMVPVKKPGRPLSACPHLHNQLCGCSSVTAAIPRKQKCHCGTGAAPGPLLAVQPRPVLSAIPDIPSPTKVTFRVQKPPLSSRPGSRKQSYDLSNLERMDANNINITPYSTSATQPRSNQALTDGHSAASTHQTRTNGSHRPQSSAGMQNSFLQSQFADLAFPPNHTNEEYLAEYSASGSAIFASDGLYLQPETQGEGSLEDVKVSSDASCCAPKTEASNGVMAVEPKLFDRTDSESRSGSSGFSLVSSEVSSETAIADGLSETQHYLFPETFSNNQDVYSFTPQPTIYEYPASYGSYQHPLQPSQWRKDFRSNMYAQPILQPDMMSELTTFPSDIYPDRKTRHSCSCGDTCQCIGCAAHPYNTATRNCVRSAYALSHSPPIPGAGAGGDFLNGGHHTNGTSYPPSSDSHLNGSGHIPNNSSNNNGNGGGEETSLSHNADSPSDSSPPEEQTLPASDYIFVNYPFSSNHGCGGDTQSCPCGDECECIGCTIHRFDESSPADAWSGEGEQLLLFANGDETAAAAAGLGLGLVVNGGAQVKDERRLAEEGFVGDGFAGEPRRSCCG